MQYMRYAGEEDAAKVDKTFKMIANGNQYLGFEEIKTLVCGIERVYAKNLL